MKFIFVSLSIILTVIFASCGKNNVVSTSPQQSASQVSIGLSMKKAPAGIFRIEGILSREGFDTLHADFVIFSDSATCKFNNISAGVWRLQVNAYDSTNAIQYTGSTNINVVAGAVTPVRLTLNPAAGSIIISVTWGSLNENLISNPSFEFNNVPSLSGWNVSDTILVHTAHYAAPGEGNWCLALSPSFGPAAGGNAEYSITGQSGYTNFEFSFYERNLASFSWGYVSVTQKSDGHIVFHTSVNADSVQWTKFQKVFILYMKPTDTLTITLGTNSILVKAKNSSQVKADSTGVLFDGISLTAHKQLPVPL